MRKTLSVFIILVAFIACTKKESSENIQNTSDITYGPDGSRWITKPDSSDL